MNADIRCERLDPEEIRLNFSELHTELPQGHNQILVLSLLAKLFPCTIFVSLIRHVKE